jgi:CBS domain-containing membrane protein
MIMFASMASSAALLFAAPHSPFSQLWNLFGGHLVSATVGWVCSLLILDPALSGGMAVSVSISLMYILKCLHPPSAATALAIVLGCTQFHHMGWQWSASIAVNSLGLLLLLTLLINNLVPGRRYPMPVSARTH